jgi:hypothetical protein
MDVSVKLIRLVTGEDLISEVSVLESDSDKQYTLYDPLKVMYMSNQKNGSVSVGLAQWVFWKLIDKQEFNIHPKDILLVEEASTSIQEYYYDSLEYYYNLKEKSMNNDKEDNEEYIEDSLDDGELLNNVLDLLKDTKRTIH